jgi:DNA-binding NtrC family response regulator
MQPLAVLILVENAERREQIAKLLREAGHQVSVRDSTSGEVELGRHDLLVLDPALPSIETAALQGILAGEPPESLDAAERRHLALVLRHTSGNKRKAAYLLGISRSTLLNKVRKYGLQS